MSTKRKLRGLEKVCRIYGRLNCGNVMMFWDYANEVAVPQRKMRVGSERWKASERARWQAIVLAKEGAG